MSSTPEVRRVVPAAEKLGQANFDKLVKNAEAWAKTHLYPYYVYKSFAELKYDKYPADDRRELKLAVKKAVEARQAAAKKLQAEVKEYNELGLAEQRARTLEDAKAAQAIHPEDT